MAESAWSIKKATYNTDLVNFNKANRSLEDKRTYCKVIVRVIDRFLKLNNINWNDDQLFTTAIDIMERCETWNVADIICFLKFVRQNPKNLKELRINNFNFTPAELFRMIPFYYEEQAIIIEERKKANILEENQPIKIMTVTTESGEVKRFPLGAVINKIADNLEIGVIPKTAMEKARLEHDIKKESEEHTKPQWLKDKEAVERNRKISSGANKLGKEEFQG